MVRVSWGLTIWLAAAAGALPQDAVSTMGASRTRRLAELGRLPTPGDVVVEDLINYHRHSIPLPRAGEGIGLDLRWGSARASAPGHAILQVGLATPKVHDPSALRPANLALVIDRSGSMSDGDKLGCVKSALREFVGKLRRDDRLAIVAYDDEVEVLLSSCPVGDGREARSVIERLEPRGATNLQAGLGRGYDEVRRHLLSHGTNRVILLTDGIANRGMTDAGAILEDSLSRGRGEIDLSTIGVGLDFNRDLLERLARGGRGLFHFVADAQDVRKVFVDEVQSLVSPVARRVRLELDWGRELRLEQVYGYAPRQDEGGVVLDLPDLNHGATMVVLAKFALPPGSESERHRVRAHLRYEDVDAGQVRHADQAAAVEATRRTVDPLADLEVRKNYTIARMAQALHDMAEQTQHSRWVEAELEVLDALRFVSKRYPSTEDEDLLRARTMLEQSRKALAQRIEVFRDL